MNTWWVGTVSALAGAVTAGVLEALRERTVYRRELSTRWDDALRTALALYLSSADRAVNSMARYCLNLAAGYENTEDLRVQREEAKRDFLDLHDKSQPITLVSGNREHPIREASRTMRKELEPLWEVIDPPKRSPDNEDEERLDKRRILGHVKRHRDAREALITAAHVRLGVSETKPNGRGITRVYESLVAGVRRS